MPDPILMCAVCQRPVERWTATEYPAQQARIFTAYCHGEKDTCRLTMWDMVHVRDAIRSGQRVEAVAFAKQALPAAPLPETRSENTGGRGAS